MKMIYINGYLVRQFIENDEKPIHFNYKIFINYAVQRVRSKNPLIEGLFRFVVVF